MTAIKSKVRGNAGNWVKLRRVTSTFAALVGVLVPCIAATGTATASETPTVRGTFSVQFPKGHAASNAPCLPEVFCGVGSLAGFRIGHDLDSRRVV
jgi:hypothetical protein